MFLAKPGDNDLSRMTEAYTAEQVADLLRDKATAMGGQKNLAVAAGVSRSFLSDAINGRRQPSGRLLDFLGLRRRILFVATEESGHLKRANK